VSATLDVAAVDHAVKVLGEARERDATVWTAGNGGGSALASHLTIGLTVNTRRAGGRPFRSSSLGADAAALSAASNDFGAENALRAIFECNARKGDILCVISVSGKSPNIVHALRSSTELGITSIALVGDDRSPIAQLANHTILLGSVEPGIAEDVASAVVHSIYCTFMYEHSDTLPGEFR